MRDKPGPRSSGGSHDDILALFTKLVASKGYANTNFGEIARELGLSKGTIVHHFTNKQRMLIEVHVRFAKRRLAEIDTILDGLSSPVEKLACFIHYMIALYDRDRDATIVFIRETVAFRHDPDMEPVRDLRRYWFGLLVTILTDGIAAGQLDDMDARTTARYIFGMTNWMWTWFDPSRPRSLPVSEAAAIAVRLAVSGVVRHRAAAEAFGSANGPAAAIVLKAMTPAG